MSPSSQPTILIIDDDAKLGPMLRRMVESAFPGFLALWAKNGVVGLEMVPQYADHLRLVVLDVTMPLLDGSQVAVQLRTIAPTVPVMPFTAHEELLPALLAMGCVLPVVKKPDHIATMPERMRQAMEVTVKPLPDTALVAALRQTGNTVLSFVQSANVGTLLAADQRASENVLQALHLIEKYRRRITTLPAREIQLAQKALQEAVS